MMCEGSDKSYIRRPLQRQRLEIGLELRQAMFINTVLFNCETWHGLKETDLDDIKLLVVQRMQKHQWNFHFSKQEHFLYPISYQAGE